MYPNLAKWQISSRSFVYIFFSICSVSLFIETLLNAVYTVQDVTSYVNNMQNKIEKNMEFGKTRNKISNFMNYVIIAITIMYIIILFIKSDKVSSKGKNKKVEYYTQPLENLSLSVYLKLCGGSVLSPNLLMATILDLHNKKVINMDSQKKVKKSFDGIEYDYYLTINEGVRLDSLNEYERIVINYLFNSNPTPNITTFKEEKIELNKRFKELSKNTYSISKLNAVCTKHDKKIESTVYEKTDSKLKRFSFIFMFCIIVSVEFSSSRKFIRQHVVRYYIYFSKCEVVVRLSLSVTLLFCY